MLLFLRRVLILLDELALDIQWKNIKGFAGRFCMIVDANISTQETRKSVLVVEANAVSCGGRTHQKERSSNAHAGAMHNMVQLFAPFML